eukprot:CAMPEP_0114361908 /NCGR_PEP_ID=MMETSP0101-20121206/25185_1 /TAXON_ID=38822 ORGANISM="Pteridomonas danica, Strain PT" /NCGR_SAMPLE_ID=MMETSP0101 /ASSEMBLY_ACC=CAM_ASM_000211 /LENGTH=181 /DNA_ID=CAMNT_0001507317 /DNA_START=421 /DNA_END=969 /DNA_ORIENTATION=-
MAHPRMLLSSALRACDLSSGTLGSNRYVVFGSALGLLAFYGFLGFNLRTTAYEILPELSQWALCVAKGFDLPVSYRQISNPHVRAVSSLELVEGDMLKADLSGARIVMLTSQCWDKPLIQMVQRKLSNELVPGTLVIDYTESLLTSVVPPGGCGFEIIHSVTAPVSWNATQTLYLFHVLKL